MSLAEQISLINPFVYSLALASFVSAKHDMKPRLSKIFGGRKNVKVYIRERQINIDFKQGKIDKSQKNQVEKVMTRRKSETFDDDSLEERSRSEVSQSLNRLNFFAKHFRFLQAPFMKFEQDMRSEVLSPVDEDEEHGEHETTETDDQYKKIRSNLSYLGFFIFAALFASIPPIIRVATSPDDTVGASSTTRVGKLTNSTSENSNQEFISDRKWVGSFAFINAFLFLIALKKFYKIIDTDVALTCYTLMKEWTDLLEQKPAQDVIKSQSSNKNRNFHDGLFQLFVWV